MEDNQTRESGGVIGSFDSTFISNFESLKTKVDNSIYFPTYSYEYTTTIEDGKITIKLPAWRQKGMYWIYVNHNNVNIWLILAALIWFLTPFHIEAANGSRDNVSITGDQGNGITIVITNSAIKKANNVKIQIKAIVEN